MTLESDMEPPLDEREARQLTTRIQLLLDSAKSTLDRLEAAVIEAYERRADVALGYSSWADYADAEFSDKARYLPRADRREFTIKLADRGLSSRAIAPVVGVSDRMVRNDVGSHFPPSPEPEPTVTTFGAMPAWAAGPAAPPTEGTPTITPKVPVTGLDGKNYTKPPAAAPRRSSLIDSARNTGWELQKLAERLRRIRDDDRFGRNKAEITAALRPYLEFAQEVLQDLDHALNEGTDA